MFELWHYKRDEWGILVKRYSEICRCRGLLSNNNITTSVFFFACHPWVSPIQTNRYISWIYEISSNLYSFKIHAISAVKKSEFCCIDGNTKKKKKKYETMARLVLGETSEVNRRGLSVVRIRIWVSIYKYLTVKIHLHLCCMQIIP